MAPTRFAIPDGAWVPFFVRSGEEPPPSRGFLASPLLFSSPLCASPLRLSSPLCLFVVFGEL